MPGCSLRGAPPSRPRGPPTLRLGGQDPARSSVGQLGTGTLVRGIQLPGPGLGPERGRAPAPLLSRQEKAGTSVLWCEVRVAPTRLCGSEVILPSFLIGPISTPLIQRESQRTQGPGQLGWSGEGRLPRAQGPPSLMWSLSSSRNDLTFQGCLRLAQQAECHGAGVQGREPGCPAHPAPCSRDQAVKGQLCSGPSRPRRRVLGRRAFFTSRSAPPARSSHGHRVWRARGLGPLSLAATTRRKGLLLTELAGKVASPEPLPQGCEQGVQSQLTREALLECSSKAPTCPTPSLETLLA